MFDSFGNFFWTFMAMSGLMFWLCVAIFVIILAACEAAVALAIVLNIYKQFQTVNVDEIDALRD